MDMQTTTAATETGLTTDIDIDAIIAIANGTAAPPPVDETIGQDLDQSTDLPLDAVTADVDAILAEINGTQAPSPAPAEKPKRKFKKSTDAAGSPSSPAAATGADAPNSVPVATDPGAFLALLTDADRAAYSARYDEGAKKVKEKADNAVSAITTGKKLSRFTSLAVRALVDSGEVTSGDLVKVYTDAGLGLGTARAQSQQMTSLFRMLGLVSQDGRSFKLANEALGKQLASVAA